MTSYTWKSAVSGLWSAASDWAPASVPGAADDVSITASGAAYAVTLAAAQSAHSIALGSAAATLDVAATLTLGGVLTLSAGTLNVDAGGVIRGGVIRAQGGTLQANDGTLDGATFQGSLSLAADSQLLLFKDGLTLQGSGGAGPGSVVLSGTTDALDALDSETLDNATITLGGGLDALLSGPAGASDSGRTLTFGSKLVLDVANSTQYLGYNPAFGGDNYGDTLANAGAISVNGSTLEVYYGSVVNSGGISVFNGAMDLVAPSGSLSGAGSVSVVASSFTVAGAVTGAQSFTLGSGATVAFAGPVASGASVAFGDGADDQLQLGAAVSTQAAISGLSGTDRIVFTSVAYAASDRIAAYSGGVLTVTDFTGASTLARIRITAPPEGEMFQLANVGVNLALGVVVCFAAGTRIATPTGQTAVEDLRPGDLAAALGGPRLVRWIGRRRIDLTRHPHPEQARPVRIRAGAFARFAPSRDLLVSPEHCIYVDGRLIPARLLLNGGSIVQDADVASIEYFHVELDRHAVLLAEGLACESYLDTGNRGTFEGALTLHPAFAVDAGHKSWAEDACAPLAVDPATVEPVWRRLRARSRRLGWATAPLRASAEPMLRLEADGRAIRPAYASGDRVVFVLRRPAAMLRLVSRAARPCDARPWLDDRRRLGVCVRQVSLPGRRAPDLAAPGWHAPEGAVCWTDGRAELGPCDAGVVDIRLAGGLRYKARRAG